MKSDRRRHPQSDPPTTGSSGDPKGYRSMIASPGASREPAIEEEDLPLHCTYCVRFAVHERTPPCQAPQAETPRSGQTASHPLRDSPEIPLGRCCHTDPAKHHPSSGTTEKG